MPARFDSLICCLPSARLCYAISLFRHVTDAADYFFVAADAARLRHVDGAA